MNFREAKFNFHRFTKVNCYRKLHPLTLHCWIFSTLFLFIFIFQILSELITRILIFKKECQRTLRCGTSERMVKAMKKIPANICPAVILHFFLCWCFLKGRKWEVCHNVEQSTKKKHEKQLKKECLLRRTSMNKNLMKTVITKSFKFKISLRFISKALNFFKN